jgi:hypothetical protein
MRKLLLLPILAIAALSQAQEMPSPKDILLGKKVFFVLTPQVKEALKLDKDQDRKIKDAFGDSLQVDGDRIMLMIQPGTDLGQMEKDAMKVLTETQVKRLNELFVQRAGGLTLLDDETAKHLKLSDDQKKAVAKLGEEAAEKVMELMHGGHDDDSAKKGLQLRRDYGKKMEALLSEEQKKSFESLKGELIKWKEDGR